MPRKRAARPRNRLILANQLAARVELNRFTHGAEELAFDARFLARFAQRGGVGRFARLDMAFGKDPRRRILLRLHEEHRQALIVAPDDDPARLVNGFHVV